MREWIHVEKRDPVQNNILPLNNVCFYINQVFLHEFANISKYSMDEIEYMGVFESGRTLARNKTQ